jgi:hypothetical protein
MAHYGSPASVMLFSADKLLNDPVAYTLLGRATFTGAWYGLTDNTCHDIIHIFEPSHLGIL